MATETQKAYKENLPYSFEDPLNRVHRVRGLHAVQNQQFDIIIVDGEVDLSSLPRLLKAGGVLAASVGAVSLGKISAYEPFKYLSSIYSKVYSFTRFRSSHSQLNLYHLATNSDALVSRMEMSVE
jgi:hypothetical protein